MREGGGGERGRKRGGRGGVGGHGFLSTLCLGRIVIYCADLNIYELLVVVIKTRNDILFFTILYSLFEKVFRCRRGGD